MTTRVPAQLATWTTTLAAVAHFSAEIALRSIDIASLQPCTAPEQRLVLGVEELTLPREADVAEDVGRCLHRPHLARDDVDDPLDFGLDVVPVPAVLQHVRLEVQAAVQVLVVQRRPDLGGRAD